VFETDPSGAVRASCEGRYTRAVDNSVAAVEGSGADPAARPASFVHDALFYRDEADYLAGTLPFLRDSLAAGMPALVAVPAPQGSWVSRELGCAAERVRFLDMTIDGRNPNRIIPAVLRAFADEHPGRPVAIVAEPVWPGRSAAEYPACVQHDAMVNVVFAGLAGTILCPYDSRSLEPEVLRDAGRTHPALIASGVRAPSTLYCDPAEVVADFNRPLPCPEHATFVLDFAGMDDLPLVRTFVRRHASEAGLSHDRSIDLAMAANEIATNTVRHAGGAGSVRVWADNGHVLCDITDGGYVEGTVAGRLTPPVTSEGGRGLVVSNHLCDLVRLYSVPGLTTVRLFVRIS
jgi:anti-sigma regulatory factor (Ser/Thr protein kinase)